MGLQFKVIAILTMFIVTTGLGAALYVNILLKRVDGLKVERDAAVQTALVEKQNRKLAETQVRRANERNSKLQKEMAKNSKEVATVRAQLAKHDFTNLVNRKPGLMEKRMQDGTKAFLKQLEEVTNATP